MALADCAYLNASAGICEPNCTLYKLRGEVPGLFECLEACEAGFVRREELCRQCPAGATSDEARTTCVCAEDEAFDETSFSCARCAEGQVVRDGKCVCDEAAHMTLQNGACECDWENRWFRVGKACVGCGPEYELVVEANTVKGCMCKDGRYYDGTECVRCAGGQTFDHALGRCACPDPHSVFVDTSVVQKCVSCPADSEAAGGTCVCSDPDTHFDGFFCSRCPAGFRAGGASGECVPLCAADSGMVWNSASLVCVCLNAYMAPDASREACVCPQGQRKAGPAVCECVDPGLIVNENGLCSSRCVRGYIFSGACVSACPSGWEPDEARGLCREEKKRVSAGLVVGICAAALIVVGAAVCVVLWLRRSGLRASKKFRQKQHRSRGFQQRQRQQAQ